MKNTISRFFTLSVIAIIVCLSAIVGCRRTPPVPVPGGFCGLDSIPPDELVVWRKPGIDSILWDKRKFELLGSYSERPTVKLCLDCDNSGIEKWSGSAVRVFINSERARAGTGSGTGPSGEGDLLYYAVNIKVKLPVNDTMPVLSNQQPLPIVPPFNSNGEKITVAVFDTGIDPAITTSFTNDVVSCQPGGKRGWNFVGNSAIVLDDHKGKHGTVVSKFIIDQLPLHPTGNMVNILPVKIFRADGSTDLFSVLCGFAYAQKAGAKIINASFGFYYYNSEPPKILYEYVNRVLTANNIILVAAAGNRDEDEDKTAATCLGISGEQLRNLDYHYFYPGGLAKYLPNVFCVTTASDVLYPSTSPNQNYSDHVVDIGTVADKSGTYSFIHPFDYSSMSHIVTGSSFATPVFTGKLASWYSIISPHLGNKEDILNKLKEKFVIGHDDRYEGKVKDRLFTNVK